jgi:hypothetical protein
MIVKKTWSRDSKVKTGRGGYRFRYINYRGWFLFGIIPLYVERINVRYD